MVKDLIQSRALRLKIIGAIVLLIAFSVIFFFGVGVGVYHWPPFSVLKAIKDSSEPKLDPRQQGYKTEELAYTLATYRLSYFALDANGDLLLQDSLPYRSEKIYHFDRTVFPNRTAIIVMDPWMDYASDHLNKYFAEVIESRIIPLVKRALNRGHPILVLTNNPSTVAYNTEIHPELQTLVQNDKARLLFHQDLDDEGFATSLRSQGITTIIYIGVSSNMCVIGRRVGMIPMIHQGFKIFFIPEASAAIEYGDTWQNQSIHKATTKLISQWIAEIIDYNEFMDASVSR